MTPAILHTWRKRLGLTQAQAAEALTVTLRSYQYWEAGDRVPPGCLGLACAAIDAGLAPIGAPVPAAPAHPPSSGASTASSGTSTAR